MATGENSGTWGTKTNTNLELIGEALGFGTEAITTNADTHTSTIADGSTDPVRAMFVQYTGTLDSACTITIAPNTVSRVHIIENATSGSQNIIIKQGSGATVTIPNGMTSIVYLDGAGSGAAVVDALTDLNIAGTFNAASDIVSAGTVQATGDTAAGDGAAMGFTSTEGLILTGQGSTNDVTIKNDADADVIEIPTGTTNVTVAGALTVGGILKTDDATDATSTTDGSLQTDGGLSVAKDAVLGNDLKLKSDSSVLSFGADGDVTLTHAADTSLTCNVLMAATTFEPSGDTAAGDNAAIGFTSAEGLILTGQGSTNDVTIKNDADEDVIEIPTGTTNVTVAGGLTVGAVATAKTDTDTSNTGSVTLDFSANQNFVLTLTGNVTLANPSTETVGQSGFIVCIQDGTGGRTLSLGTDYETAGGAGITLSSAASATDIIPYVVAASNRILLGAPQLAFS
tara:strand:- start:1853 stop:3220 length:1368 start_codon:yes stop_codon:yes gene_type:complete